MNTGLQFDHWTVVRKDRNHYYLCRCSCGTERVVYEYSLKKGISRSCGCAYSGVSRITHGEISVNGVTVEYTTWNSIKARCHNPRNKAYALYGGRGILMSDEWMVSFERFLEDMGRRPTTPGSWSIHRKDNDLGYSKDNCIWATSKTQNNERRNNRILTFNGESKTLSAWSENLEMTPSALHKRLSKGWDLTMALTKPKRQWPPSATSRAGNETEPSSVHP